jgi:hypothetical protein
VDGVELLLFEVAEDSDYIFHFFEADFAVAWGVYRAEKIFFGELLLFHRFHQLEQRSPCECQELRIVIEWCELLATSVVGIQTKIEFLKTNDTVEVLVEYLDEPMDILLTNSKVQLLQLFLEVSSADLFGVVVIDWPVQLLRGHLVLALQLLFELDDGGHINLFIAYFLLLISVIRNFVVLILQAVQPIVATFKLWLRFFIAVIYFVELDSISFNTVLLGFRCCKLSASETHNAQQETSGDNKNHNGCYDVYSFKSIMDKRSGCLDFCS